MLQVKLKLMSEELTTTIEAERRKFAKILHDGLTQELTAASLISKVLRDELEQEGHSKYADAAVLHDALVKASASLQSIYRALNVPEQIDEDFIPMEPPRLFPTHE